MGDGEIGAPTGSIGGNQYIVDTTDGPVKTKKASTPGAVDTTSQGGGEVGQGTPVSPKPGVHELSDPKALEASAMTSIHVGTAAVAVAINLMLMCRTCRDIAVDERRMGLEGALLAFGQALEVAKELKDLGKKKAAMYTTMAVMAGVSLCFTAVSMGAQLGCARMAARSGTETAARQWGTYGEIAGQLGRIGGSVGEIANNLAQAKFAEQEGNINYYKTLHEAIQQAFQRYGGEADKAAKNLEEQMRDLIQLLQRVMQVSQQLYTSMQAR